MHVSGSLGGVFPNVLTCASAWTIVCIVLNTHRKHASHEVCRGHAEKKCVLVCGLSFVIVVNRIVPNNLFCT